jgi:hypothetical protein
MDPDPNSDADPATAIPVFVRDLQGVNKNFFCFLLFESTLHLHNFSKIKKSERSKKIIGINVFLIIFG